MNAVPHGLLELLGRYENPRVLDFGCGHGRSAIDLLDAGFDVYGVDIDEEELATGRALLKEAGHNPNRFQPLGAFEDGIADVIYSQYVFEHVSDLSETVREIARLTAPGGAGLHEWPGRRRILEPHLYMPFLHWLPKNRLRYWEIRAFQAMRIGYKGSTPNDLYRFTCSQTFYRPFDQVAAAFKEEQFTAESVLHPKAAPLKTVPGVPWAVRTFRTAILRTSFATSH